MMAISRDKRRYLSRWLGFAPLVLALSSGALAQVNGAGATFPSKVYERWAQIFERGQHMKVIYKATNSEDGVRRISARTVDFAAVATPMVATELVKRKLIQVPMVVGGIVPVVNLAGVPAGRLQLTGEVLADIMAGHMTKWNDARIVALNPELRLPPERIRPIVRADEAGTTEAFTLYLSQVSAGFKSAIGVGQTVKWPAGYDSAGGNDGLVKALKEIEGGVTYVSYDRVVSDNLNAVRMRNPSGAFVVASEVGFRAAIVDSDLSRKGDDLASLMNRPAIEAWPITLTSFVLVDAEPATAEGASPALRFLYWCFMHGDELTRGTGFAPLPVNLQARLAVRFSDVKPRDGKLPSFTAF